MTNAEWCIHVINDMARRLEKFRDEVKPEEIEKVGEAAKRLRKLSETKEPFDNAQ